MVSHVCARIRAVDVCVRVQFQDAVDALIRCSEDTPEDAASYWNVGVLLSRLKDYDNALSWMGEAIHLNSSSVSYFR